MASREPLLAVDDLRVQFWTGSGLVYAVNSRPNSTVGAGRIVFVSTAKLDALLG